jgi:O-antigen/teichoic acid export membrane protein
MLSLPQNISAKIDSLLKEERSRKLLINVLSSFLVKIFSMAATLYLVRISYTYLDKDKSTYGVWLTLASVITWFNIFDLGLSNGLTNKLTQSFAKKELDTARTYLSTTYGFLVLMILIISIPFIFLIEYLNWNSIFNTTLDSKELRTAIHITYVCFCFTFIFKPINDLLKSKQKHFILSIIQLSGNVLALLFIIFLGSYFKSRFLFLCISLASSYPIALLFSSLIFYLTSFRNLVPHFNLFSKSHLKDIFGLSAKFFIIQLSVIAILTSNNFLISYFVGTSSVSDYTIGYRLFSIITIFQVMIMTPLWPAFTDAYTLKDFKWIRSAVSQSNKLNLLLCIPLFIMYLTCDKIYRIWIAPDLVIPAQVNILLAIFVGVGLFKETYVSFINGTGKLNLQTIFSICTIILQIPLAYLLTRVFNMGISGILVLNIFWVTFGLILWRIQYGVVMNTNTSSRLWH